MIRLENLDLDDREAAQEELASLADALRAHGAQVEVAGLDESCRAWLQHSVGDTAVDVLNVVLDVGADVTIAVLTNVIYDWAKTRRHFRGSEPGDRPQARLWVVEDGREYDYPVDLDEPRRRSGRA